MANQKTITIVILIAAIIALPIHSVIASEGEGSGDAGGHAGGMISNLLPTVETIVNEQGETAIVTRADTFNGTVKDRNGEQDIKTLRIEVTGTEGAEGESAVFTYTIPDSLPSDRPTEADGVWRVWNPSGPIPDGELEFEFEYTYNVVGVYTFEMDVKDQMDLFGDLAQEIIVTVTEAITIDTRFVHGNGTADKEDARWGGWLAAPGESNVLTTNFLGVTNTGDDPMQEFTVDFTDTVFKGVTEDDWKIDINDNIEFACAETLESETPNQLAFDWNGVTTIGSATCQFSEGSELGAGVIYVQYRIVQIPEPMMVQSYAASFTVSA